MSKNRIPKSIQAILERAENLRDETAQQQDVKDKETAAELERQSRNEWEMLWMECGPQLPKEIRIFASRSVDNTNFDLGWNERAIPIRINGLAPFIVIFHQVIKGDGIHFELVNYRCATPIPTRFEEPGDISWQWLRSGHQFNIKDSIHALEGVLLKARGLMSEFQDMWHHEQELRVKDDERATKRQQYQDQGKAEEENLLDSIKYDPIAMLLLKALVLVHQEQSGFMAQIEGVNFAVENDKNRMNERLKNLKQQAEAAQRETEEERCRKEDLQDELDKAEKKAKRGW